MPDRRFTDDLAALCDAFEAGLDLPGTLAAACRAAAGALGVEQVCAYVVSDDGATFVLAAGDGPGRLERTRATDPTVANGRTLLPLVSARRSLGFLVASGEAGEQALERGRIVAAMTAQAVEAARLWESAGAGAGTLDLLTGLPNHRGFQTVLTRELARAKRTGASLAVSVVDLDGLTAVNERHGRGEGDRLLRLAADCFARGVRSYDCACRLGDDEFALVLPGMSAEAATTLVSRLSATFARLTAEGGPITASGGVASFPHHAATQTDLVRLAGGALARAQAEGGARIVAFDPHRAPQDEAAGPGEHERTLRALEASRGTSARSRAVSQYAGLLGGELGLDAERIERLRLAAYVYDSTSPGGTTAERARVAARVAASALDGEAAEWILAHDRPSADRPLETRILAVAEAFVLENGHVSSAGAGRALAGLWTRADAEFDRESVRALERLLDDDG